ncbi:MAG: dephospho-CoA kinase [Bacteroidetes bacterium]|nr:dephospho-CoA kinase [Bacteroidota bacterium]
MKIIGITGGIGSGKSVACKVFRQLGIPVYDADLEAKKLYETVPELAARIRKEFSEDVFDKKGKVDRQKLSEIIFNDSNALKKLNKIVHPYVLKNFEEWVLKQTEVPYVIKEAAILFESGADAGCDHIITVTAPAELRMQRILQRDKRSKSEVELIMQKQWSEEEKIKHSDFVITNDEKQMLIPQVLEIHAQLLAEKK